MNVTLKKEDPKVDLETDGYTLSGRFEPITRYQ